MRRDPGAPITLHFLEPPGDTHPKNTRWLVRDDRPVRYLVPARLARRFQRLLP